MMRFLSTRTTAFSMTSPPVPSINSPPEIAMGFWLNGTCGGLTSVSIWVWTSFKEDTWPTVFWAWISMVIQMTAIVILINLQIMVLRGCLVKCVIILISWILYQFWCFIDLIICDGHPIQFLGESFPGCSFDLLPGGCHDPVLGYFANVYTV